ncbi:tRNA 2-thiouridine(34) synthase MnmA [Desulfobotulus sp. H1]|uniref:tRNA-specific 2-thiouridylase MnmA n=1 Tax=Desulfobotulus pelophilus TaxID=2823377 RepID=A0ABT3N9Z3_9BACT|nr:tRNA 2-thiouridine(34) synthase MnmA [Desulfobotulus pelophilus]MCW7754284.1 tRNA 2-thiouridine(34) synthase MnmA [Desulfobotulus pelophilus]
MSPILVAVSGGIDSLVTARILQEQGHEIQAAHFLTGYQKTSVDEDMRILGQRLGCRVHVLDFSEIFRETVIKDFVDEYRTGRTPNPCLVCNPVIKFGALMDAAETMGCKAVATGHYARILDQDKDFPRLLRGKDPLKDQSYFLSQIPKERLGRILFPLGELTKEEVRNRAVQAGLQALSPEESQDICFLPDGKYGDFLEASGMLESRPGPITTRNGTVIGTHLGLHRYTVGQRRGLGCPGPAPYHVLRLDTANNRLVVGFREEMMAGECRVSAINWLIPEPEAPLSLTVKIRYRHQDVPATLYPENTRTARIRFHKPQAAVSPGQGAVFYLGDRVLGGGFIDSAHER